MAQLRQQLQAIQAIDVDLLFKGSGKVIIIARVMGQDIVKIIDVHPDWRMVEYQDLVRQVRERYGVDPKWVDAGPGPVGRDLKERLKG